MYRKNRKLCMSASTIQKILSEGGYWIAEHINSQGDSCYWLVENGKPAWEGVFLCQKEGTRKCSKKSAL